MATKYLLELHPSAQEGSGAGASTGNSREFPEAANFKRMMIFINVTAISGTLPTLDFNIEFKDPISGNYLRVQSKNAGTNANAAFTNGDWTLGNFTQTTAVTNFVTYARALTDTEMIPTVMRLGWLIGGTVSPRATFSAIAVVETESP